MEGCVHPEKEGIISSSGPRSSLPLSLPRTPFSWLFCSLMNAPYLCCPNQEVKKVSEMCSKRLGVLTRAYLYSQVSG